MPTLRRMETPHSPIRCRPPCVMLSALGRRSRGFDARRDIANEAFEASVHLFRSHARWHRPGHEVSDAIFSHERCQFLHAVFDIADHPGLRDARLPCVARNAAGGALVLVEAAIDLAAIAFGGAYRRPVALGIVGDEARA